MNQILADRPNLLANLMIICGTVGCAVGLELFLRRRYRTLLEDDQNAINSVAAAVLGVYGLILGLTLAAAWERYQQAEIAVYDETNSLFTVFRLSDTLPADQIAPMKAAVVEYGIAVAFGELTGHKPENIDYAPGRKGMRAMYKVIADSGGMSRPPANNLDIMGTISGEVVNVDKARGTRLTLAQQALPREFWVVLLLGAVFTLGAVVAILPTHPGLHVWITAGVSILLVSLLILLRDLDQPFEGTQAVDPDNYRGAVTILRNEGIDSGVAMPDMPTPTPEPR